MQQILFKESIFITVVGFLLILIISFIGYYFWQKQKLENEFRQKRKEMYAKALCLAILIYLTKQNRKTFSWKSLKTKILNFIGF